MEIQGIEFVKDVLQAVAILAIAMGVLVALSDIIEAPGNEPDGRLRTYLKEILAALKEAPWAALPSLASTELNRMFLGYMTYWFGLSKSNFLPAGVYIFLLFFAVPLTILINFLQGGAPWLFDFLISIVIAFGLLVFLGENKYTKFLSSLLSLYLFATVFLVLPGYIFTVVNGRMLLMPTGHAAIGSVLIAPLLYFLCYSLTIVLNSYRGRGIAVSIVAFFIAIIPLNYLLTFAAFTAGHLAAAAHPSEQNWSLLLGSVFFSSLAAALTFKTFQTGKVLWGFVVSAGVGIVCSFLMLYIDFLYDDKIEPVAASLNVLFGKVPAGDSYALNPQFWVMHLPLIPFILYLSSVALGIVAKCLVSFESIFAGKPLSKEHPFLVAGILLISNGGILVIATRFISI